MKRQKFSIKDFLRSPRANKGTYKKDKSIEGDIKDTLTNALKIGDENAKSIAKKYPEIQQFNGLTPTERLIKAEHQSLLHRTSQKTRPALAAAQNERLYHKTRYKFLNDHPGFYLNEPILRIGELEKIELDKLASRYRPKLEFYNEQIKKEKDYILKAGGDKSELEALIGTKDSQKKVRPVHFSYFILVALLTGGEIGINIMAMNHTRERPIFVIGISIVISVAMYVGAEMGKYLKSILK